MAEGTVLIRVTSSAAAKELSAKAFSARINFPPRLSGTNSSNTETSKEIEVDASTPEKSASAKICRA